MKNNPLSYLLLKIVINKISLGKKEVQASDLIVIITIK